MEPAMAINEIIKELGDFECTGLKRYVKKLEKSKTSIVSLLSYGVKKGDKSRDYYVQAEQKKEAVEKALFITGFVLAAILVIAAWVLIAVFVPPLAGLTITHILGATSAVTVGLISFLAVVIINGCASGKSQKVRKKESDINSAVHNHRMLTQKLDHMIKGVFERSPEILLKQLEKRAIWPATEEQRVVLKKKLKHAMIDEIYKQLVKDKSLFLDSQGYCFKVSQYIVRDDNPKLIENESLQIFGHRIRNDNGTVDVVGAEEFNRRKKLELQSKNVL